MTNNLDDIIKLLVQIPSVSGRNKEARKVVTAVNDLLGPTPATIIIDEMRSFPYLMASTQKPNKNTLWFVCHLDVVAAAKNMFRVTSDKENYYGRGVFDMKGMAAATLSAFLRIPNLKQKNVGLLFTTDEEIGGKNGVGALVDKTFRGAAAFVFDQSADWVLQEKMKGLLWLQITATGKAAHGARPWLGQSANHALIEYLAELKTWYENNIPTEHPHNYYTTFNIGTIRGGEATNQVADAASATIDIRFVDEHQAQKVSNAAYKLAKRHTQIVVTKLMHDPCVNTNTKEKWYKKTEKLMRTLHIVPGPSGERFGHGSTDGRFFAPHNIPVITTRPLGGGQHGPTEWVSKLGLTQLEQLCFELMSTSAP